VTPETEALLRELDEAQGSIDDKVDAIRFLIERNKVDAIFYAEEAARYEARGRAFSRTVDRLKDWIMRSLDHAGLDRAGRLIPQRIQANGGRPGIEWTLIGEPIPEEFRRIKTSVELDKDAVYEALASGRPLPPGIKVTSGRHLRDVNVARKPAGKGE
jgi:hypothetical protein